MLCPAGSLDEAWLSGTSDSRIHKLETVLATLIGRRIFLAAEAAGNSDEVLYKPAMDGGAAANTVICDLISDHLKIALTVTALLSSVDDAVSNWTRQYAVQCGLTMINVWQFISYLNQLLASTTDNARQLEKSKETVRTAFDELHDGETDPDYYQAVFACTERLLNIKSHYAKIVQTAEELKLFLMAEQYDFLTKNAANLDLQVDTDFQRSIDALLKQNSEARMVVSLVLQSTDASKTRRATRAVIEHASPAKRFSSRRSMGAGNTQMRSGSLLITNSTQDEPKIIDGAIVAANRLSDSMLLHAVDADLVTSTGVSCTYNQIPLSIEGFCPVAASRPNFLLLPADRSIGLIKYAEMFYGFSSVDAAHDFVNDPVSYLSRIWEKSRVGPDLIELLDLHEQHQEHSMATRHLRLDGEMNDVMAALGTWFQNRVSSMWEGKTPHSVALLCSRPRHAIFLKIYIKERV